MCQLAKRSTDNKSQSGRLRIVAGNWRSRLLDIANVPGKGMEIFKNGSLKKTIDGGMDFKKAVFAIWLGEDPVQKPLKNGMLGK